MTSSPLKHKNPGEEWCDPACKRCAFLKSVDQSLSAFVGSLPLKEPEDIKDAYESLLGAVRDIYKLSARESQVVELLIQGMSNREIAASLKIEENTAKFHVRKVLIKLKVKRRAQVPMCALRLLRKVKK